jgi:Trk K+ transport system NAD-binding subunit
VNFSLDRPNPESQKLIRRAYHRLALLVVLMMAVLLVMSLLYMVGMNFLEEKPRNFWQALQWAAGTTSTTGYGVDTSWKHPLMVIYVVLAQFMGVTMIFLVLPIYLIPMLEERFETRLPKASANARNHVVIFDYSPAVATLVTELRQARIPTIVIDEDEAEARHLLGQGHQVVYGNLDEGVLEKSNLAQARALIVNGSDDRNAATILAARQLGFAGEILALVEDPYHRQPMILAGATGAFTPRHVLGAELAARASEKVSPTVTGIQHLGHALQVAEARITRECVFAGKTLGQSGICRHAGVTVIGQWVGGKLVTPATPDMRLDPGGILILVGNDANIRDFLKLCAGARRLRRDGTFLIAGAGEVGRKVAQLLGDCGEKTLVIDSAPGPGVDLVGNVLDTQVLRDAGLESAQALILALSADATTLFSTVIAKDLAPDVPVIARVNRIENLERIYVAGADFALSIGQVSGQLLAWRLLGRESVSVDSDLRVVKVSTRGLESRHPKQEDWLRPTGCAIVAAERGEELLVEFGADFSFRAGDVAYICGSGRATQRFLEMYPQA